MSFSDRKQSGNGSRPDQPGLELVAKRKMSIEMRICINAACLLDFVVDVFLCNRKQWMKSREMEEVECSPTLKMISVDRKKVMSFH